MNQLRGPLFFLICSILSMLVISNCTGSSIESSTVHVYINVDQQTVAPSLPQGSTVSDAIQVAGIEVDLNDKVSPPEYTTLMDGMEIKITRVSERSEVVSVVLPFERQIVKNESIPEGEIHLLQPGKNGLEEITYRVIEEEGIETARVSIRRVVLEEPVPEIMMVGTQQGYTPLTFPGTMVYVSSQNAWLIEGETGSRRPITSTGDLDGRILELSPDGRWLVFTRELKNSEDRINSLWLLDVTDSQAEPIDLKAQNIIHYADWSPLSPTESSNYILAYSTVEPRPSAPGWQANNDLRVIEITNVGAVTRREIVLETNSGGQYGWWGTNFAWSPDGEVMAYSRADSIGFVDFEERTTDELLEIIPYQTGGDWAWLPPIAWGFDSQTLYFVGHGKPSGLEKPEASQVFDLMAIYGKQSTMGPLLRQSGMFAHLAISPKSDVLSGERMQVLAVLKAIDPLESETSRYRLFVMDRDGSNQQSIFPPLGEFGLEPGKIVWAPDGSHIATLYQGNLWVIEPDLGIKQRITADGQTIAFDWSQ